MLNQYLIEFTDMVIDSNFEYPNMSDIIIVAKSIEDATAKFNETHKNTDDHRFYIDKVELL